MALAKNLAAAANPRMAIKIVDQQGRTATRGRDQQKIVATNLINRAAQAHGALLPRSIAVCLAEASIQPQRVGPQQAARVFAYQCSTLLLNDRSIDNPSAPFNRRTGEFAHPLD